jgi:hypothetical protein
VRVIEEDDGSGWVKVVDEDGDQGLVPASYVESADPTQATSPGPLDSESGQFGEWLWHLNRQPGVHIVGSPWVVSLPLPGSRRVGCFRGRSY